MAKLFFPAIKNFRLGKSAVLQESYCDSPTSTMIDSHETNWLGYPIEAYMVDSAKKTLPADSSSIYRLSLDYDSEMSFSELFARFAANPAASKLPAIIIGQFTGDDPETDATEVVRLLVSARTKLKALRGIFLGEVVSEECEISWIHQCDVSPLFDAYPGLEHFRVRGSDNLSFGAGVSHAALKSLTIETGGLPPALLAEVLACQFPALEHLELWLGTPNYGGEVTVEQLEPLLSGRLFPNLKSLGLRDSEIADEVARAVAQAPLLRRLQKLDLSMGILTDKGAKALLASETARRLQHLDLHYHFLSGPMMKQLGAAFQSVNVEDRQEAQEDERYVAVSE